MNRVPAVFERALVSNGMGSKMAISTSKIRNSKASKKKGIEKFFRAVFSGLNPHSNGLNSSLLRFLFLLAVNDRIGRAMASVVERAIVRNRTVCYFLIGGQMCVTLGLVRMFINRLGNIKIVRRRLQSVSIRLLPQSQSGVWSIVGVRVVGIL